MTGVGQRIKQRRYDLGWTQEAVCAKAGITKGFLSDLENGKRGVGADTLLSIGRALGLSLDYLAHGPVKDPLDADFVIPRKLFDYAKAGSLSVTTVIVLIHVHRAIVKGSLKHQDPTVFDWQKLHEALEEWL